MRKIYKLTGLVYDYVMANSYKFCKCGKKMRSISKSCKECWKADKEFRIKHGENKGFKKGMIPWNKGLHVTNATTFKKGSIPWNKGKDFMANESHPLWKGDKVGYYALHTWLKRNFGNPDTCEECGNDGLSGHMIHWANVTGKYERDRSNWKRLCAQCHWDFDKVSRSITRSINKLKKIRA